MYFRKKYFFLLYLLKNCIFDINCVPIPQNLCPDIFQYIEDNNDIYGKITIPYSDGRKSISVAVAAWMPGYYPQIKEKPLEIELITPFEKFDKNTAISIIYHVKFPFKDVVPRISKIGFNERIICNGIPEPPNDGTSEFTVCSQTHHLDFPQELCTEISKETIYNNNLILKRTVENKQTFKAPVNDNSLTGNEAVDEIKQTSTEPIDDGGPILKVYIDNKPISEEPVEDNKQIIKKSINEITPRSIPFNDICGKPVATNSLIVYGQGVPRGGYPWLVAIFLQRDSESISISYICSGSLISDKHVIVAAHCVKMDSRRLKPNEIFCVFGKLNIKSFVKTAEEQVLEPESIIIHPEYKPGKANADIAVITFTDPIAFNQMIKPLCLWKDSTDLKDVVGNIGTVVGWGKSEFGKSTAKPRQINMPIVDHFNCLIETGSPAVRHALMEIVSINSTFCAGNRDGSGPCMGDSGSAFLLQRDGTFYLRGIVSTALSNATYKSCNLDEYVVFTDASKYFDWIMDIISGKNKL